MDHGNRLHWAWTLVLVLSLSALTGCPPQTTQAPNVVAMTYENAVSAINAAGFSVGRLTETYSESTPAGYVISQSPGAGTAMERGESVDLVISLGRVPQNEGEGEAPEGEAPEGEVPEGEPGPGYDEGYQEGFFTDVKYWEGYYDSYDTEPPDGPLLYTGSNIPYIEEETYEAGYYDGLWYAYNDGYFVSYDYGFTIGFSEGYDVTFNDGWYDFLIVDEHPEYSDGSFLDGYMDGFSEGSVFGAYDYKTGLSFDWEDAMWDYRSGTDLYLEEVGFGTGQYGNVFLYEYGVDPAIYFEKSETNSGRKAFGAVRIPRNANAAKAAVSPRVSVEKAMKALKQDGSEEHAITYRALSTAASTELNVRPQSSPRLQGYTLTLPDTWLERIERYRAERQ